MTFLQPFVLWGLPLILLPVLIHLLNRMRHRPQPWAAMRFLVSATRSSVNNARLRQWLILALRVLAVLMLILFVGRPLAGGWLGWALAPAPDAILVLLDRSASMESQGNGGGATKREQAVRALAEALKPYEEASHLILIDSATRLPQEIGRTAILNQLPSVQASDTAADIPGLMKAALNWLLENRAGTAEVWLASDLQRSNWLPDDPRWSSLVEQFDALPQRVRVRLLALNSPGELNRSVALSEMLRRQRGEQSELHFAVDVQASDPRQDTVPLTLVLDGTRTQTELAMEAQALRWRHRVKLGNNGAGSGWGSFELPADGNRRDNVAYFVYGAETPLRASIVSADPQSARLLQLAASAGTRNAAEILAPANLDRVPWEDNTLLVWQGALPTGASAQRLRGFVEEGGTVVFLPGGQSDPQRFEGLGWGEFQVSPPERPFRILRWNEEEGPLAKTDEGFSLPVSATVFQRRQNILGPKNVLAAFEDGTPFLARQPLGRGEVYFCGSLPLPEWSTLGEGPVLVPMLHRLLQSGSRRLQKEMSVNCGELSMVDQGRRWEAVDSSVTKDIRTQAGVYRSGERLLAVNRPRVEDNSEVLEPAEATRLFGPLSLQMLQEKRTAADNLQGEVWRMFLFAMLLFLVVEGILILPARAPVQAGSRTVRSTAPVEATP
jgi:hypothetical protein